MIYDMNVIMLSTSICTIVLMLVMIIICYPMPQDFERLLLLSLPLLLLEDYYYYYYYYSRIIVVLLLLAGFRANRAPRAGGASARGSGALLLLLD